MSETTRQRIFTDAFINALKPKAKPYKRAEHAPKGDGRLTVRVLPSGVREFFYRYRTGGGDKTLSLGRYGDGRTLADIRKACRTNRTLQDQHGDVKEHLAGKKRLADIEARKGSFEQMLTAYADSLEAAGKSSAKEVRGIFRRHVTKPFPTLAKTKANDIRPGDIQTILGKMVQAGLTRQVNKARSYSHAAFVYGGKADNDPRTSAKDGVLFGLTSNPVALVPVIGEFERAGDRVLDEDELREYWKALDSLPIAQCATLRVNLALACQRPTQLVRSGWPNFDFSELTLMIRDSKGRGAARDHLLPLTDFVLEQLAPLRQLNEHPATDGGEAPLPFSSFGSRPLAVSTLSRAVRDVSAGLKREQRIPSFKQGDLRRTAETMLQKLGVEREVRAHLLSHGRGKGVQGRHYERYDFLAEKRQALKRWAAHLRRVIAGKTERKVVPMRRIAA